MVAGLVGVQRHGVVVVVRAVVVVVCVSVVAPSVSVRVCLLACVGRAVVIPVIDAVVVVVHVLDVAVFGSVRALSVALDDHWYHHVIDESLVLVGLVRVGAVLGVSPSESVRTCVYPSFECTFYWLVPRRRSLFVIGNAIAVCIAAVSVAVVHPVSWDGSVIQRPCFPGCV